MEHVFYIDDRKKKKKKYIDEELAVEAESEVELPWNKETCWEAETFPPLFRNEYFKVQSGSNESVIEIATLEELIEITKHINQGEWEYQNANYSLIADIDCKGKKLVPIGEDDSLPFKGIFNGNGHLIENFKIKGKKRKYGGLFGCLRDAKIMNLTVDGIIENAEYAGGIAGMMEGGIISCCGSAIRIEAIKYAGGLVGKNRDGFLVKTYAVGTIHEKGRPWFLLLLLLPLLYLLLKMGIPYPSIPVDGNVQRLNDGLKPGGGNTAAFEFNRLIIFKDGIGELNFYNPGNSTQDIVVKLTITDEELIDQLGESHRTLFDQKRLELLANYDPKLMRQELAVTGRIPAGSSLMYLELKTLQDGTELPPGTYKAIIELTFYDTESQEKALLNSQLPVGIRIE
ncbi:hypothetical protein [Dielma fastidiosa]|nr:hypothetical protein [Dielma fastidiosa]